MTTVIDRELAAMVIVEAAFTTDEKAARRPGVSVRSVQRWRRRLSTDPLLLASVRDKKIAVE